MPMSPKLPFKLHTVMFLRQPYPLTRVKESGFWNIITCEIWNPRLENPEYSSRSPESIIQVPLTNTRIQLLESRIQDCLGFPYRRRYPIPHLDYTLSKEKEPCPISNYKSVNLYSISDKNLWPRVFDRIFLCDLLSQSIHLLLYQPQNLHSLTSCCQPRRPTTTATTALLPPLRAMRLSPGLFSRILSKYPSVRYSKQLRLAWRLFQGKGEGGWGDVFGRLGIPNLSLSLPAFKSTGYDNVHASSCFVHAQ